MLLFVVRVGSPGFARGSNNLIYSHHDTTSQGFARYLSYRGNIDISRYDISYRYHIEISDNKRYWKWLSNDDKWRHDVVIIIFLGGWVSQRGSEDTTFRRSPQRKDINLICFVVAHAQKNVRTKKSEVSIYRPIKKFISKYHIDIKIPISAKPWYILVLYIFIWLTYTIFLYFSLFFFLLLRYYI